MDLAWEHALMATAAISILPTLILPFIPAWASRPGSPALKVSSPDTMICASVWAYKALFHPRLIVKANLSSFTRRMVGAYGPPAASKLGFAQSRALCHSVSAASWLARCRFCRSCWPSPLEACWATSSCTSCRTSWPRNHTIMVITAPHQRPQQQQGMGNTTTTRTLQNFNMRTLTQTFRNCICTMTIGQITCTCTAAAALQQLFPWGAGWNRRQHCSRGRCPWG